MKSDETISVVDKIRAGAYKASYPSHPKQPACFSKRASEVTSDDLKLIEQYKKAMEEYKKEKQQAREEERDLELQFRKDLEEEAGIQNHPKTGVLYSKAYSQGHSSGMEEVYNVYMDLAELLT